MENVLETMSVDARQVLEEITVKLVVVNVQFAKSLVNMVYVAKKLKNVNVIKDGMVPTAIHVRVTLFAFSNDVSDFILLLFQASDVVSEEKIQRSNNK